MKTMKIQGKSNLGIIYKFAVQELDILVEIDKAALGYSALYGHNYRSFYFFTRDMRITREKGLSRCEEILLYLSPGCKKQDIRFRCFTDPIFQFRYNVSIFNKKRGG